MPDRRRRSANGGALGWKIPKTSTDQREHARLITKIAQGEMSGAESNKVKRHLRPPSDRLVTNVRTQRWARIEIPYRGEDEADPKAGSISFVSLVARLLTGKVVGTADQEFEIIAIS